MNPNKKTHKKEFVKTCKDCFTVIKIECELGHIERCKDRAKMEQTHYETTLLLQKAKKKKEREKRNEDAKKN